LFGGTKRAVRESAGNGAREWPRRPAECVYYRWRRLRVKKLFKAIIPLSFGLILTLSQCSVLKLDVPGAAGNWSGSWHNTTFSSTGTATMVVTVDDAGKTISNSLDLNGNVFGGADPAAQTVSGTYTDSLITLDSTTALFGHVTLTIDNMGKITGTLHPAGFDSVTISGTATPTKLDMTYTIYQPANTIYAQGTLTLTKQ
jgi:hypothetical protein